MRIKQIGFAVLAISAALLLNSVATEIEYGEAIRSAKVEYGEVKTVEELHGYDAETDTDVPEIVTEAPDYVTAIACDYGLDPDIIKAIIEVESGGDPEAVGDDGEAIGLMQIHPAWHSDRMKRLNVVDLTHPVQNVLIGCDILSELLNQYGNYDEALQAYNSGHPDGAPEYSAMVLQKAEDM